MAAAWEGQRPATAGDVLRALGSGLGAVQQGMEQADNFLVPPDQREKAAGAVTLRTMLWPSRAEAAAAPAGYLLLCYFSGGWDQMLALDPRDATAPQFQQQQAYAAGGSGIYPAYDKLTDAGVKALLAQNPTGIQTPQLTVSTPLTFGPAVPASLFAHAQDLCLVRGVNMGTLTHEVGRRYFITGKFPRGLQAAGSSLPTPARQASARSGWTKRSTFGGRRKSYRKTCPCRAISTPWR